jgi:hypothetical protein
VPIVLKSGSLKLLERSGPVQGLLYHWKKSKYVAVYSGLSEAENLLILFTYNLFNYAVSIFLAIQQIDRMIDRTIE